MRGHNRRLPAKATNKRTGFAMQPEPNESAKPSGQPSSASIIEKQTRTGFKTLTTENNDRFMTI